MSDGTKEDPVEKALELLKPMASQLSFGAVMGYCSGVALKKIGKAAAFVTGVLFIGVQGAVSTGYVEVDWAKISNDTLKKFDLNTDGKFDTNDLKLYWKKFKKLMVTKLPSSGGFSLGFLYGVRYG